MGNNHGTPDTTEADVGHEKTHFQNKMWTLRHGKGEWKGRQVKWPDEVRGLSNWRIAVWRVRRSLLYEEDLKPT